VAHNAAEAAKPAMAGLVVTLSFGASAARG
jgi:hypothetical protein